MHVCPTVQMAVYGLQIADYVMTSYAKTVITSIPVRLVSQQLACPFQEIANVQTQKKHTLVMIRSVEIAASTALNANMEPLTVLYALMEGMLMMVNVQNVSIYVQLARMERTPGAQLAQRDITRHLIHKFAKTSVHQHLTKMNGSLNVWRYLTSLFATSSSIMT